MRKGRELAARKISTHFGKAATASNKQDNNLNENKYYKYQVENVFILHISNIEAES